MARALALTGWPRHVSGRRSSRRPSERIDCSRGFVRHWSSLPSHPCSLGGSIAFVHLPSLRGTLEFLNLHLLVCIGSVHGRCASADVALELAGREVGLEHLVDFLKCAVTCLWYVKEREDEQDRVGAEPDVAFQVRFIVNVGKSGLARISRSSPDWPD